MNFPPLAGHSPTTIVQISDASFLKHYKTLRKQFGGRVHQTFNTAIADFDFLKIVMFNNDRMNIPPAETFLAMYESSLPSLTKEEKRCLGGLFGNLFRFVFNYTTVETKQYRSYILGSAAYFCS